MTAIDKLIEAINLPKRVVDNAELFLRKLLGPAIKEGGQMIADQVRYRRFRNQVVIFSKANELLRKHSIEPRQINLKILHPTMEYSSLEEDESLQNIWANFIANISSFETEAGLNLKCIDILKDITPKEIFFLDYFFSIYKKEEKITLKKWAKDPMFKNRVSAFPSNSIFSPWMHTDGLGIESEKLDIYVDRLLSLGLMKFEQPALRESSDDRIIQDYFTGTDKSIKVNSYELENSDRIHFTAFGLYFVRICKYGG